MFVKGLRKFLYAGALLALAPIMANATHKNTVVSSDCGSCAAPAAAPCAPAAPTTCKVKVCEWVDEPCEYTRTTYKPVTTQETYTAYKCETVSETKTKQVTEYKKVCTTVMENRTVTKKVPVWTEKTEMVTKCKLERVTEMVTKTKLSHHWECVEVPARAGLFSHLASKCADPCDPCATSCAPCTKTVKKLVIDRCTECVPVCKMKLVKECVPVCKKVCTYECVTECIQVPVTKVTCVPECKTVTYTECKKVMVPYQATRCVTKCEAVNEVVKGTKKVAHWVEKEVAVAPACDTCATTSCCGGSLFGGLKARLGSFGHKKSSCCESACGAAASCGGCN